MELKSFGEFYTDSENGYTNVKIIEVILNILAIG